jgi:hypothetical protein
VPDPARAARAGRPDACTLCHTDRTRRWAAEQTARLFGVRGTELAAASAWSEVETQAFAGDPVLRALSAAALGQSPAARRPEQQAMLLDVMERDPYPAVRRFAARALARQRPEVAALLERFVPETPAEERAGFAAQLHLKLAVPELDQAHARALRAEAAEQAIDIGE